MPTVGKKKFPYTPAGEAAAERTAKRTGQPLKVRPGMGGMDAVKPIKKAKGAPPKRTAKSKLYLT
jgi:hypothetical protein